MPAGRPRIELNMAAVLADDAKGMNTSQLAVKYGVSAPTMYQRLQLAKASSHLPAFHQSESVLVMPSPEFGVGPTTADRKKKGAEELTNDADFDKYYIKFRDWLGFNRDYAPPEAQYLGDEDITIVAGDFHVPYHNENAMRWMLDRTINRANTLIIGGDLADMFTFSKYMKNKVVFSALEEIKRVQAVLAALSEAYPVVHLLRGNHDDRFFKFIQRMGIPSSAVEVFDYLHGEYSLHPIYVLARSFPNVHIVEPIKADYAEFCYLYQHGDCVVSHAEKYSQVPNKTVGEVIDRLMSYHVPEGLLQPFRVVVQCHTHQAGKTWNDYGKVGIENGCMALTPDYSGGAKNLPRRASIVGYTELVQRDGVSDFEKTNFIPYKT